MKRILPWLIICLLCPVQQAFAQEDSSRFTASIGLGFLPRDIFGQETFYQESVRAAAGGHFTCPGIASCGLVIEGFYQRLLSVPEYMNRVSVERREWRSGLELGMESYEFVPVGFSLGYVYSQRNFAVMLDDAIVNQSSAQSWKESARYPSVRVWTGVSMLPNRLDLLLTITHHVSDDLPSERNIFASEIRFAF